MKELFEFIRLLVKKQFTGELRINFHNGGISKSIKKVIVEKIA